MITLPRPTREVVHQPTREVVPRHMLEGDVAESFCLGELAGALDRGRGNVDPERTACLGRACGLSGCLPSSTADVEGVVVELDANGSPQYLVVPP
jgi:hypothetical protein